MAEAGSWDSHLELQVPSKGKKLQVLRFQNLPPVAYLQAAPLKPSQTAPPAKDQLLNTRAYGGHSLFKLPHCILLPDPHRLVAIS